MMHTALLLLLGGLGAGLRFALSRLVQHWLRSAFPLATFLINVSGSLLLGILYGLMHSQRISYEVWLLFGTGLLGAFTTFSTFGVEAVTLIEQKKYGYALFYVFGSALIGLVCAWLGMEWMNDW